MTVRRAGRYTAATALVLLGVALLADNLTGLSLTREILRYWPVILIVVGLEYLFWSQRGDTLIRLDWGGLILLAIISTLVWRPGPGFPLFWMDNIRFNGGSIGGPVVYEHLVEKTVPMAGVHTLEIKSGATRVEVVPGSASDNQIRFRLTVGVRGMTDADARANAERVFFDVRPGSTTRTEVTLSNLSVINASLHIEVPAALEIDADAGSGGIRIQNMKSVRIDGSSGPVRISDLSGGLTGKVASGGLDAGNIRGDVDITGGSGGIRIANVGGKLRVEAGSGGANIRDVAGDVELKGSSGRLRLDNAMGRIKAVAGSGGVEVVVREVRGDYELRAGSGSVELTLPRTADAVVTAQVGSGGISGPDWLNRSGKTAAGTLNRGSYRINLETGSGPIRVGH